IFNRYLSCLVYIPRDRFDSELVEHMGNLLARELKGTIGLTKAKFGSLDFARVHYIVNLSQGQTASYDLEKIEEELIGLARSWKDDLKAHLQEHLSEWQ